MHSLGGAIAQTRAYDGEPMSDQNTSRWAAIYLLPLLIVEVVIFLVLVLIGVGLILSLIIALLVGGILGLALYFGAQPLTARLIGAQPTGATTHPRLENTVEELCARSGVSEPELFMVNSDRPDAVAFGTSPSSAALAVTNGLMNTMSVVELEGVLARELSRIRNGDIRFDTLAVAFVRAPLAPFGGLARKLITWARGEDRDVIVDMAGVEITRYPPGLTSALSTIQASASESAAGSAPGSALTDHLWTRGMHQSVDGPGQWSLDERIAVLQEL